MELAWLYCAGITSLVQCSSLLHFVSAILVFIARPPIGLFCLQSPTKCVLILHIMWWTFKFLINSIFQFNLLPWLVGAIIGSKGSKISQTRQESGANIKVSDETLPQSTEKTVQVKGVTQSVLSAVQIILNQLSEVTDRAPRQVYTSQTRHWKSQIVACKLGEALGQLLLKAGSRWSELRKERTEWRLLLEPFFPSTAVRFRQKPWYLLRTPGAFGWFLSLSTQ